MALEEGWVNIGEVASHLSVGRDSIYRWVDAKGFPAHKVGRLLRFRLSEVDEWVREGGGSHYQSQGTGTKSSADDTVDR
jgi:excisionase family DNA binding protein